MAPTATQAKTGTGQKQAAAPAQPFRVGVYDTDTPDIQVTLAATAAAQKLGTFKISPNGWLSSIHCTFQGTGYTAATFTGDNPFSGIQKVTFKDVGNREIFGPLTGYEWMSVNKWGGYYEAEPDPRNPSGQYAATGGTGYFQLQLFIPLEIVLRDTLGEIETKSSSSSYTLEIYIDSQANTLATSTGTLTWTMYGSLLGYTEPEAADAYGRPLAQSPPAAGTVQYWTSEIYNSPVGSIRYNQVNGIGYPIRNLVYIAYDSVSNTRATAWTWGLSPFTAAGTTQEWPNPLTLAFGKVQLFQRYTWAWADLMARWYGLTQAGPDANLSLENGVFVHPFTRDFDSTAGQETRNSYLITKAGNVLQISGTVSAVGLNIHVLTNYVVPPGNDASKLRAR
jgi:hypothetical protein